MCGKQSSGAGGTAFYAILAKEPPDAKREPLGFVFLEHDRIRLKTSEKACRNDPAEDKRQIAVQSRCA